MQELLPIGRQAYKYCSQGKSVSLFIYKTNSPVQFVASNILSYHIFWSIDICMLFSYWRFQQVCFELLSLLIRPDIPTPCLTVQLFVTNMNNTMISIRKVRCYLFLFSSSFSFSSAHLLATLTHPCPDINPLGLGTPEATEETSS